MKKFAVLLIVFLFTIGCDRGTIPSLGNRVTVAESAQSDANLEWAQYEITYAAPTPIDVPEQLQYFDIVNSALPIEADALEILSRNGFVIDETHRWERFIDAYAWIYWQDLPVLITTDSILHALHQSYDDLLKDLESQIMLPRLDALLSRLITNVESAAAQNADPEMAAVYADVMTYLNVAKALANENAAGLSEREAHFYHKAHQANGIESVNLFGVERKIDFTTFEPRGHYRDSQKLTRYFLTMMWFAKADFAFVTFDATPDEPTLHPKAVAAAMVLFTALDDEAMINWQEIDALAAYLVGESDNMTPDGLARFLADAGLEAPGDALLADEAFLLRLLLDNDYGLQQINGGILERHVANASSEPVSRPVSFMLFGQRFAIDSYVMGNLVYDRMHENGRLINRPLASPLDVMFALGNGRALTHLDAELDAYGYGAHLVQQRQTIERLPADYWQQTVYNRWLHLLQQLDVATTSDPYPATMRSAAWADKMLHTQLASWAQLRRDNILYVKQPYTTTMIICYFPDGYVEPYSDFYAALNDFAVDGLSQVNAIDFHENDYLRQKTAAYFQSLAYVAGMLEAMSERQLSGEPFTAVEAEFLQNMVIHQIEENRGGGCGGPRFTESWDGWYRDIFYSDSPETFDENPAVIADVATNPNNAINSPLYPPRILHAATGHVVPIFFVAERDGVPTLFVGASFTYYEHTTKGNALTFPDRVNDDEWRELLTNGKQPLPPVWTEKIRVVDPEPTLLLLPKSSNEGK